MSFIDPWIIDHKNCPNAACQVDLILVTVTEVCVINVSETLYFKCSECGCVWHRFGKKWKADGTPAKMRQQASEIMKSNGDMDMYFHRMPEHIKAVGINNVRRKANQRT